MLEKSKTLRYYVIEIRKDINCMENKIRLCSLLENM